MDKQTEGYTDNTQDAADNSERDTESCTADIHPSVDKNILSIILKM